MSEQHPVGQLPATTSVVPKRGEVIHPLNVNDTKQAMQTYQQGVRQLLNANDYQSAGRDRDTGRERRFVKRSGLLKIGLWFDLSVEVLRDEVDRAADGTVQRCTAWARATAANGRYFDGDGHCDVSEERFQKEKGRQRLEHDLRATATTRAMNRAIAALIGMGDLDDTGEETGGARSIHGPEADTDTAKAAKRACTQLAGGDVDGGVALWRTLLGEHGGYMPQAAAAAVIAAADALPAPGDQQEAA